METDILSAENNKVLIVAAHPDDEILGSGATIAKLTDNGFDVHILIAGEGAKARKTAQDTDVAKLHDCAIRAASILGANEPRFLCLPDNKLDTYPILTIIQGIEEVIKYLAPATIYTHHGGDLNIDHEIIYRATLTAARPVPLSPVKSIYTFETVSSTEWSASDLQKPFSPVRFVDITDYFDKKLKALSMYEIEIRPFPHARSIAAVEAVARMRGASVGMSLAEAFGVVRELIT